MKKTLLLLLQIALIYITNSSVTAQKITKHIAKQQIITPYQSKVVDLSYSKQYSSPEDDVFLTRYTIYDFAGKPSVFINATHDKKNNHISVDIEDAHGGVFNHIHTEEYDYEEPTDKFFGINGNYRVLGGDRYAPQLTMFFPDKSHERINVVITNANDYRLNNSPFVAYILKDEMQPSKAITFKKGKSPSAVSKSSNSDTKSNLSTKESNGDESIISNNKENSDISKNESINNTPPETPSKFQSIEKFPTFKNRVQGLDRFIAKNLKYPKAAMENKVEGKVIVTFTINEDGSLSNIKVARGIGYGCDEEALRLIKLTNWIAGEQGGKKVKTQYSSSIPFVLK